MLRRSAQLIFASAALLVFAAPAAASHLHGHGYRHHGHGLFGHALPCDCGYARVHPPVVHAPLAVAYVPPPPAYVVMQGPVFNEPVTSYVTSHVTYAQPRYYYPYVRGYYAAHVWRHTHHVYSRKAYRHHGVRHMKRQPVYK